MGALRWVTLTKKKKKKDYEQFQLYSCLPVIDTLQLSPHAYDNPSLYPLSSGQIQKPVHL